MSAGKTADQVEAEVAVEVETGSWDSLAAARTAGAAEQQKAVKPDRLDELFRKAERLSTLGDKPDNKVTDAEREEIGALFAEGFTWTTWDVLLPILRNMEGR